MLWRDNSPSNKIFLAKNGLVRIVDNKVYLGLPFDYPCNKVWVTDDGLYIVIDDTVYPLKNALVSGLITSEDISNIKALTAVTRKQTGLINTVSDILASIKLVARVQSQVKNKPILIADQLPNVNLSKTGLTPVVVVQTATHLFYADTEGVYVWLKQDLSFLSYALVSGITGLAINNLGLYIGTALGVYFITLADILTAGNRTVFLSLKFTSLSSPSIQSNAVLGLAGFGTSLVVASSAGLDYMPNSSLTTVYRLTDTTISSCSLSDLNLAFIAQGLAYIMTKPAANFTLNSLNKAGQTWQFGDDISTKLSTSSVNQIVLSGDGKMAVDCKTYKLNGITFYTVNEAGDLTLISTFNLAAYYYTNYGNSIYIGEDVPQIRGNYLFVFPIGSSVGSYNLSVFYLNTTAGTYSLIYTELHNGTAYGDVMLSPDGLKAHTHRWGSVQYIENRQTQQGYAYTMSPTAVSVYTFWAPSQCDRYGWTPDGAKLVIRIPEGMAFCSSSGVVSAIRTPEVSSPVRGANAEAGLGSVISGNYLYVGESRTVYGRLEVYLCVYDISGSEIVFIDKLRLQTSAGTLYAADGNVLFFLKDNLPQLDANFYVFRLINNKLYKASLTFPTMIRDGEGEIRIFSNFSAGGNKLAYATYTLSDTTWLESTYYIKINKSGSIPYTIVNSLAFAGNDLVMATDMGLYLELSGSKDITKNIASLDPLTPEIFGVAAEATANYFSGELAFYTANKAGNYNLLTLEVNPYTTKYLNNITSAWIDNLDLQGNNNLVFIPPQEALPFSDFAVIKGKSEGVFSPGQVKIKTDLGFIPVVKQDAVYFMLNSYNIPTEALITFEVFRTSYSYRVQLGDTTTSIGEAFAGMLRQQGYKAVGITGGFMLDKLYGLFTKTPSTTIKAKSPFIRVKLNNSFVGI